MSRLRPLSAHGQHKHYRGLGQPGGRATDRRPEKCGVRYGVYYFETLISLLTTWLASLPLKSLGQSMLGARLFEVGQTAGAANHRSPVA
ncbi:MAG: hypothetical protein ACREC0_01610 [Methylocella sp.]